MEGSPHRRWNALSGEWVLVSPHRTQRPWQGQIEKSSPAILPDYDPGCYLCPGNQRAGGKQNPEYDSTFVFTNDFPALLPDVSFEETHAHELLVSESVRGTSRVICFSPQHNLTMPEMSDEQVQVIIDVWAEQTLELGSQYRWVQIFENKGSMMGSSNPHPHGQVWASDQIPSEPLKEDRHQRAYFEKRGSQLLVDYASLELSQPARRVAENVHWLVVVPFWAVWPYEVLVLPRRHVLRLPDLVDSEKTALAQILKTLTSKYDRLFGISFPYSMGWHGAPHGSEDQHHWQLHAHFYPPLLRSATVKKFLVGYEMLAEAQRDLTPEQAAERLRDL